MKSTYHFLTGQVAVTKTFDGDTKKATDEAAIEFAKSKKGVIRVQCDSSNKHIWESEPEQKKTVDAEALLDQVVDKDAEPPVPASAARSTVIGLVGAPTKTGIGPVGKMVETFLIIACLMLGLTAKAATIVGVIGTPNLPGYAVNSQLGGTQYTTVATNGLYSAGLVSAVAATAVVVTETNLVQLNPGLTPDKDIVIQFGASALAATGATNTIAFNLSASVLPVTITNSIYGQNASANPRSTLGTYTLAFNGTTPVTTNIVLSPASTPAIANGESIFLESIGVVAGATATNYYVAVVQ